MYILYYLLKVIAISAVLYGYYWFFLRNKLFHSYNRFYLLSIVFLSIILPLVKINFWEKTHAGTPASIRLLQAVNSSDEMLDEVVVYYGKSSIINTEQVLYLLFIAICIAFTAKFIKSIYAIHKLKKKSAVAKHDNLTMVFCYDKSTPFSFFRNIFWNNDIDITTEKGKQILQHELVHVNELHTHDKLFINIVLIVFWCNPVFWLLRRELNIIHEFIADNKTVAKGDTAALAQMILQTAYPTRHNALTNSFFYSPIKRRIAMIKKQFQNPKVGYAGRVLALPLTVLLFAAFTLKTKKQNETLLPPDKTFVVVIDAGHGGEDVGAISSSDVKEKDISLKLAQAIYKENNSPQLKILLTRSSDISQDAKERTEFAKNHQADLFISIHVDADKVENNISHTGMSVWVSNSGDERSNKSEALASAIIQNFKTGYDLNMLSDKPLQRANPIWVLSKTKCPSVLVEAGFITNANDIVFLSSMEGQTIFAKKLLSSIQQYLSAENQFQIKNPSEITIQSSNGKYIIKDIAADEKLKDITLEGNVKVATPDKQKALYIINGIEVPYSELVNKEIEAKRAVIYDANDKEAIKKYGAKAINGVFEFYDAGIKYSDSDQMVFHAQNATLKSYVDKGLPRMDDNMLYVVNEKKYTKATLPEFGPNEIKSFTVYEAADAKKIFGENGINGAIVISTIEEKKNINDERPIKIEGEIKYPGIYKYHAGITLQEIIDAAGGLLPNAQMISILRNADKNTFANRIVYPIDKNEPGFVPFSNIKLLEDDVIRIFSKSSALQLVKTSDNFLVQISFDDGESQNNYVVSPEGTIFPKGVGKIMVSGKSYSDAAALVFQRFRSAIQKKCSFNVIINNTQKFNFVNDPNDNKVFNKVEVEAQFPGGSTEWTKYLQKNLDGFNPGVLGAPKGKYHVMIKFIVAKDGTVSDVVAETNNGYKMEEYSINLIKNGPKWLPALQNGIAVNAYRRQPITFVINEDK